MSGFSYFPELIERISKYTRRDLFLSILDVGSTPTVSILYTIKGIRMGGEPNRPSGMSVVRAGASRGRSRFCLRQLIALSKMRSPV